MAGKLLKTRLVREFTFYIMAPREVAYRHLIRSTLRHGCGSVAVTDASAYYD